MIISQRLGALNNRNVQFYVGRSNGEFRFVIYGVDASGVDTVGIATSLNFNAQPNTWHHIAGIYDGANIQLYIDGILKGITPYTGAIRTIPGSRTYIGSNSTGASSQYWNGLIDEVRIYNRALSAAEVSQLAGTPQGGGVPASPAMVAISLNASTFVTGNALTLTGTTVASTPATTADIYYALRLPNSTLLVMQPDGSFSTAITPFQANVAVPDASSQLFTYTFSGLEPAGSYTWYAALMQPGSMTVIGLLITLPFTFTPPPPASASLTGSWTGMWTSTAFPGSGGSLNIGMTQLGSALSGSGTYTFPATNDRGTWTLSR